MKPLVSEWSQRSKDLFARKVGPVDPVSGCMLWTASVVRRYGFVSISKKGGGSWGYRAHRVAYEMAKGPIPEGYTVDHLCRTPLCVNPEHLEAVTPAENTLRGIGPTAMNARKTHCKRGHPFDESNTKPVRLGRWCRRCDHLCQKAWRDRNPNRRRWA